CGARAGEKTGSIPRHRLERILQAEDLVLVKPYRCSVACREVAVNRQRAFIAGERCRVRDVSQKLHLRQRIEAARGSGIPDYENDVVFGSAVRAPSKEISWAIGRVVVVDTEQRHVEVVSRICEVVWIAPE